MMHYFGTVNLMRFPSNNSEETPVSVNFVDSVRCGVSCAVLVESRAYTSPSVCGCIVSQMRRFDLNCSSTLNREEKVNYMRHNEFTIDRFKNHQH